MTRLRAFIAHWRWLLAEPRMSAFVRTHPDIRIELQEAEGEDLLLAIAREQTDLVVCRQPPVVPAGWGFVPLVSDRFAVVASPGDPLLGKRRLSWDRLQARQWLLSSVHTQARQRFEALCSNWPSSNPEGPAPTMATVAWRRPSTRSCSRLGRPRDTHRPIARSA